MYTNIFIKEVLQEGVQFFMHDGVSYLEMDEPRMIEGLRNKGLKVTQTETAFYKKHGYINRNESMEAFVKQIERVFAFVELVENENGKVLGGKKRRYVVAHPYDEVQPSEVTKGGSKAGIVSAKNFDIERLKKSEHFKLTEYRADYLNEIMQRNMHNMDAQGNKNCVYRLLDEEGQIIYIGLSGNLLDRVQRHLTYGCIEDKQAYENARFEYVTFQSETLMHCVETYLIGKHQPKHNTCKRFAHDENDNVAEFDNLAWTKL